jgi:hypothetical protein
MINLVAIIASSLASLTLGALVKGILWLREVKTNHLPHMQAALEAIPPALEKQTNAIVQELKEQRADIRTLSSKL